MTPQEIEKTLDEATIMLLNSTATKPQKTGIRECLAVLRKEMAVMAKMIDIHKTLIIELLGNDSAYAKTFMTDWREQAEAELKGGV